MRSRLMKKTAKHIMKKVYYFYQELGKLLNLQNKYNEAIICLNLALKYNLKYKEAYLEKGTLKFNNTFRKSSIRVRQLKGSNT